MFQCFELLSQSGDLMMIKKVNNTLIIKIDPKKPDGEELKLAAEMIRRGELVAFPTETVYGLGADGLNPVAVRKIFKAKGRPQDNPLILHIAEVKVLDMIADNIQDKALKIMSAFWPGPLTLIFNKKPSVPDEVTAGLSTVAVRMPSHPVAVKLIKAAGIPIAAPSANLSGRPSPTTAEHVVRDLSGKIAVIIDGGSTEVGLESTVLDITCDPPTILRPGGVTYEELIDVVGDVRIDPALENEENFVPKSPGQKYTHYSPKASVIVVEGPVKRQVNQILKLIKLKADSGLKPGVLATDQTKEFYNGVDVISLGDRDMPYTISARLFSALREMDDRGVDVILAEGIEEKGIGLAVMNRLRKAAGYNIIKV